MKVEFTRKFSKDIDNITSASIKQSIKSYIKTLEQANDFHEIANTKKLKGHRTAYRTRIGDYRLGFFYEKSTITLARFLHRKDIYKLFP